MQRTTSAWAVSLGLAVLVALAGVAAPDSASAQYVDETDDMRFEDEFDKNEFHVVGRVRAIGIPNFFLDAAFDKHSAHWRNGQPNFAYGAEFVWRKAGAFELSVAAEYADLGMPSDWWLEKGENDRAADYIDFDLGMASLVFSGYWFWDVNHWFSPYVGGGLGLGVLFNNVERFEPKPRSNCKRNLGEPGGGFGGDACFSGGQNPRKSDEFQKPDPEDDIWPVAPVINITGGARFNIKEHGVIKVEVGFYDYVFAGISGGARW
ncbi:MAG: hypothetical protein ABEL76_17270 [Bradymonadaceae bacterium]